jgi:ABC-type lipoprotein export system ATPase subunit
MAGIRSAAPSGSGKSTLLNIIGLLESPSSGQLRIAGQAAEQLDDAMQSGNLSKVNMAQRMATSRSQLDRVLDPNNLSMQLDTLIKAANAVGRTVEIRLKPEPKRTRTAAA